MADELTKEQLEAWKAKGWATCPLCGGKTHWRRGVHFEHERRCPQCDYSFDPKELADELKRCLTN